MSKGSKFRWGAISLLLAICIALVSCVSETEASDYMMQNVKREGRVGGGVVYTFTTSTGVECVYSDYSGTALSCNFK